MKNIDTMIEGMIDEILITMERDTEAELPWSEFIEFMDEVMSEKKALFHFLKTGEADYDSDLDKN